MRAVVECSGRQYQLTPGKFVDVDLTIIQPGQEYVFEQVLMLMDEQQIHIGEPYIKGARVVGKVLSHGKSSKIIVYKQRPKKGTRKKQGHRQQFTRILVNSIEHGDKKFEAQ